MRQEYLGEALVRLGNSLKEVEEIICFRARDKKKLELVSLKTGGRNCADEALRLHEQVYPQATAIRFVPWAHSEAWGKLKKSGKTPVLPVG